MYSFKKIWLKPRNNCEVINKYLLDNIGMYVGGQKGKTVP